MRVATIALRRISSTSRLCSVCCRGVHAQKLFRPISTVSQHVKPHSFMRQQPRSFKRGLHISSGRLDNVKQETQVHPLGDFYADLLADPIPKDSKARTDLPTFVNTGGDLTKEERAARLFGTIKGSGYERQTSDTPDSTWRTINGVPVPPRPAEPDNCCMSGCAHCVWDDYRDDVESWAVRLHEAQAKGVGASEQKTPKVEMNRPELSNASGSMDDDGGGSEALWTSPSASANDDALFAEIPVGIREFMAVEKRIRDRKKSKRTQLGS